MVVHSSTTVRRMSGRRIGLSAVPIIDFSRSQAPRQFTESVRTTGFGVLADPPIRWHLVEDIQHEWLGFFASEAKYRYRHDGQSQAGFFPFEPEALTAGKEPRDQKEFFHVCPSGPYPTEVSQGALEYFKVATGLGATLLQWLQVHSPPLVRARFSMSLPGMLEGATGSMLRIQHYLPLPPCDAGQSGTRAAAHTDINLLTVLPAPTEPGLQLLDRHGSWRDIPSAPNSVIVNSGEMLQLVSGGYYTATVHRVVSRTAVAARSRLSLPLFLHPASGVLLDEGVTAGSFLRRRVAHLRRRGWGVAPGGDP
jgi:isopenicillin N synthase-like dioxygenase